MSDEEELGIRIDEEELIRSIVGKQPAIGSQAIEPAVVDGEVAAG